MWSSTYYFEVTEHQILPELCPIKNFHKLCVLANAFYSLHPIMLKSDLLLDVIEQRILLGGYSTPNISRIMPH